MTRSLNVKPKTTEQNLFVHVGKSEAEVTDNNRLHLRYCIVEATTGVVRPLCDSGASCV